MRRQLVLMGATVCVGAGIGLGTAVCRSIVPPDVSRSPSAASAVTGRTPSRQGAAAAPTPRPPDRPLPCQKEGYDYHRTPIDPLPRLTFCNNTPEPLAIRRLDVPGLQAATLPPDTYGIVQSGGPVFGPMSYEEAQQSSGVIFGVFDQSGRPRGRFLFTAEHLVSPDQTSWVCLSMAAEPPFVVRQAKDFPFPCP
jgi:hypothetical protein